MKELYIFVENIIFISDRTHQKKNRSRAGLFFHSPLILLKEKSS